jgi:hypothetical protein
MRRAHLPAALVLCVGACAAPGPPLASPAGDDGQAEGFALRSADGRDELVIGGLFQVLGRLDDDGRDPRADAQLKRMRPELSGRVRGGFRFQLEPNFAEDGVELEEAWIGPELPHFLGGGAQLQVGRGKAPFGLEEVRSRRHIDFPTFSRSSPEGHQNSTASKPAAFARANRSTKGVFGKRIETFTLNRIAHLIRSR